MLFFNSLFTSCCLNNFRCAVVLNVCVAFLYIYIYTYIDTYIHTYIHTYETRLCICSVREGITYVHRQPHESTYTYMKRLVKYYEKEQVSVCVYI